MGRLRYLFAILTILFVLTDNTRAEENIVISGSVKDAATGEGLVNALVYTEGSKEWCVTDKNGRYSIKITSGARLLYCSYMGYLTQEYAVQKNEVSHDFLLESDKSTLEAATVSSVSKREEIALPQMGRQLVDDAIIRKIPTLLGENDVVRVIQMLPGVQSPSEGSTGFSVRGGGIDQNLIMIDGAPVYSSGHLLGFLSMFNGDAVKNAELFKGDFPAKFGGRMSSVLNVNTKDGDINRYSGSLSVGFITSKVHIEGPIVKSKVGFSFSARRTYMDLFIPLVRNRVPDNTQLYFWDLNAKLNWVAGEKDRITLSALSGKDVLGLSIPEMDLSRMKSSYMNNVQSLRWSHTFSQDASMNVTLFNTLYDSDAYFDYSAATFKYIQKVHETGLKIETSLHLPNDGNLNFGADVSYFILSPGETKPAGENSIVKEVALPKSYGVQPSLYAQGEQKLGPITLRAGLRFSSYSSLGPAEQRYFDPITHELVDTVHFNRGKIIKTYFGIEPRLSASWSVNEDLSVKASYSRAFQYLQQAMVGISGSPIDSWFSASPNVKPQISDQFAVGINKLFLNQALESSLELFYKGNKNIMDFKDNPGIIIDNPDREGLLRFGRSRGYGAELMLKYDWRKWSGWISYTWSKVMFHIPEINGGIPYRSPLSHEHAVNFVLSYDVNDRLSVSGDWIFYSGAPTTFPVGSFNFGGSTGYIYSSRNADNMPDYHRADLSLSYKTKARAAGKRWSGEWNLSIYNLYARHNAWSISFNYNKETNRQEAVKIYLFTIVPSLSYNITF